MTREEAIKEIKEDIELYIPLRGTIDDVDRDLPDGRLITALEMAIKALKQEPCEDAVSRQAVLDIVDSYSESQSNVEDVTQDIISDIVALLSVNPLSKDYNTIYYTPQLKTGHWIPDVFLDECSVCGKQTLFLEDQQKNFCPNCGAKMVEPQETETWNGIHGQITAPKGTFERIFNEADDDSDI